MRVATDQFADDAFDDLVDAEGALAVAKLGLKNDLQQQIAKLLAMVGDVAGL